MSTVELSELKEELSQWVGTLTDEDLLSLLNTIKMSFSQEGDWWNSLTTAEQQNIQLGLEDHDKGRTISSTEFWQKLVD